MDLPTNPLALLTFLSAPAVLTSASCELLFGTGNRYGRAIDRVHELAEMVRAHIIVHDEEQTLRINQLRAGERRAALDRIHQAGGSSISVITLAGEIAGDLREPRAQQATGIFFELAKA